MATKKEDSKETRFETILMRDNKSIQATRAKRIGSITANALQSKKFELEKQLAEVEDKLERQLDLSTSNVSTSINRIENWDADTFVSERLSLMEQKYKLEIRQKFLSEIEKDLF